mgnify:CR=1 FL=1|jgi:hypothetical protein
MKHLRRFNESNKEISIYLMGLVEEIESQYDIRCDVSHDREKSKWYIEMNKCSKEQRSNIIHSISVGLEEILEDFNCKLDISYFIEDWKWIHNSIKSIKDLIRLRISNKPVSKINISLIYEN